MLKYYSLLFKQSYCICANTQSLLCIQDAEREILHLIKCLLPLGIASRVPVCNFSMSAVEFTLYASRRMEKKNVTSKMNNSIWRRSYGVKVAINIFLWQFCGINLVQMLGISSITVYTGYREMHPFVWQQWTLVMIYFIFWPGKNWNSSFPSAKNSIALTLYRVTRQSERCTNNDIFYESDSSKGDTLAAMKN